MLAQRDLLASKTKRSKLLQRNKWEKSLQEVGSLICSTGKSIYMPILAPLYNNFVACDFPASLRKKSSYFRGAGTWVGNLAREIMCVQVFAASLNLKFLMLNAGFPWANDFRITSNLLLMILLSRFHCLNVICERCSKYPTPHGPTPQLRKCHIYLREAAQLFYIV